MREGKVFYKEYFAGIITETDDGEYVFQYDEQYVEEHPREFITFTMPVTSTPFTGNRLFPFFDGLIPEGWLLDIASENWKINKNDRMGLLLACCRDCIGAVSVIPIQESNRMVKNKPKVQEWVNKSFLSENMKGAYLWLIEGRYEKLS